MRWMVVALIMLAGCAEVDEADETDHEVDRKPQLSFAKSASANTLTVVKAEAGADWMDLRVDFDGCQPTLDTVEQPLASGSPVTTESHPIQAGQRFEDLDGCRFTLSHIGTNELYNSWQF